MIHTGTVTQDILPVKREIASTKYYSSVLLSVVLLNEVLLGGHGCPLLLPQMSVAFTKNVLCSYHKCPHLTNK